MDFFQSERLNIRKLGLRKMKEIFTNPEETFFIHYSCESFFNLSGRTPRIVSIALMNLEDSQTKSYSIHLESQIKNLDFSNLSETEYDVCEKSMLKSFYQFISKNKTKKYVHWMMINTNYGFSAIENRYKILKGQPTEIEDKFKYDLSEILKFIYGDNYEVDENGRLFNISKRNNLNLKDFLLGKDEAFAFESKEWLSLNNSTLVKVKLFKKIAILIKNRKLKTKSSIIDIYGLSLQSISEVIQNNTLIRSVWWLILVVIGYYINKIIELI